MPSVLRRLFGAKKPCPRLTDESKQPHSGRVDIPGAKNFNVLPEPANPQPKVSTNSIKRDVFRDQAVRQAEAGDYEGAINMYNAAISNGPPDASIFLLRSYAHMLCKRESLDLAVKDVNSAIELDPMNWEAWKQKGELLHKMNDPKAAIEALENAVGFSEGRDRFQSQASLKAARVALQQSNNVSQSAVTSAYTPNSPNNLPQNAGPASSSNQYGASAQQQGQTNNPRTNTTQSSNQPPVSRAHNSSTVSQTPASAFPQTRDELINLTEAPNDHPPPYSPATMTRSQVEERLRRLEMALTAKRKGSLTLRPYTGANSVDAVQLLYVGMTMLELTNRELGIPVYLHYSFTSMTVHLASYPGSTLVNMDLETSVYYEGKLPGTVSISGFSLEYREHQLSVSPLLQLHLEGSSIFAAAPIDKIVQRLRVVQKQPDFEDDEGLKQFLGLSMIQCMSWGFGPGGSRQKKIDSLCMALTRSFYDAPTRFIDFSKSRNFTHHTHGGPTGIGKDHFLYQILIGAEILIRLRKEPTTATYGGIVTDNISALVVLSSLWMQNVTIEGPKPEGGPRYLFYALEHRKQIEGLIKFGEAMAWPYMDEARHYLENSYRFLTTREQSVGFDMCDWLYGLVLPGKHFRHRIMSCLVYASPTVRSIDAAPFYENGLIVASKSYWPKRTVLGRVLGGLRSSKAVCGWIGPVPAPHGKVTGWIRLNARKVDVPVPLVRSTEPLASHGFDSNDSSDAIIEQITNPSEWISPTPPFLQPNDTSRSDFKGYELTLLSSPLSLSLDPSLPPEEYRATLEFEINGSPTKYTLYSNPMFVAAPPCVGSHIMHRREAQKFLDESVRVPDLKDTYPADNQMLVINALGPGEELVARAWCAEQARHAVIRRGEDCCFSCATAIASKHSGTGANVLIWSKG